MGCIVGAVFDSSVESSSGENADGEAVEEMVTPVRPRTTEDLFAAIHRYVFFIYKSHRINKCVFSSVKCVHGKCYMVFLTSLLQKMQLIENAIESILN